MDTFCGYQQIFQFYQQTKPNKLFKKLLRVHKNIAFLNICSYDGINQLRVEQMNMQNYIVRHQFRSPLGRMLKGLKQLFTPKKHVPLKRQLTANQIITKLTCAINQDEPVTIQINQSLLSEEITELTGYVYQTQAGQLWLHAIKTHQSMIIIPGTIRHITLLINCKA